MKKFTFLLILFSFTVGFIKAQDSPEYITNIDINNRLEWQLVLGSYNYDTNYGIYIKFGEDFVKKTRQIKFKIINYKGSTKLGIKDVIVWKNGKGEKRINVHVQALNSNRETNWIDYNDPLDERELIVVERVLIPMFTVSDKLQKEFETGKTKITNKYFQKKLEHWNGKKEKKTIYSTAFADNLTKQEKQELRNKLTELQLKNIEQILEAYYSLIDTEFFYIDGDKHIYPKADYDEKGKSLGNEKLAGIRCKYGNNRIKM